MFCPYPKKNKRVNSPTYFLYLLEQVDNKLMLLVTKGCNLPCNLMLLVKLQFTLQLISVTAFQSMNSVFRERPLCGCCQICLFRISKTLYPGAHSVFRLQKHDNCPSRLSSSSRGPSSCECSSRQCAWFVFDHDLVLPEYMVDFEYMTRVSQVPLFYLS